MANGKYMADGEMKLVALEHAVRLAMDAPESADDIVESAEKFYYFLMSE